MATVKTILYPRPALTRIITQWADGEWELLMMANREAALYAIRGTVDRLVLPSRCARMRQEILTGGGGGPTGERAGKEPRKELLGILLGNLRYHGYIHREGSEWTLSPLTPRQIHLVRLMADGYTLKSAATRLGVAHSTTRRICQTAMESIGVHTATALVGSSLYQGWMPCRSESENLARSLGDTLGPGYLTR